MAAIHVRLAADQLEHLPDKQYFLKLLIADYLKICNEHRIEYEKLDDVTREIAKQAGYLNV